MSWRSKGVPLTVIILFLVQLGSPLMTHSATEIELNEVNISRSISLTNGSGHDLAGTSLTVDGVSWDVMGESVLDHWEYYDLNESNNTEMDMVVTEDGVAHICLVNTTSIQYRTIHVNGSVSDLLVESPSQGTLGDCSIAISPQERIYIAYSLDDDLRFARLAEINAVYLTPTWHLRTILEDDYDAGLTIEFDSNSQTHIMFRDNDSALCHMMFNTAFWNTTIIDQGPVGEDIEFIIDDADLIHLSYLHTGLGEIRLLRIDDNGQTTQILARGTDLVDSIGMDLDANAVEQITYALSDGLGNNTLSLLRSLSGEDSGRIDPNPKWTLNYDDDSPEGVVTFGDLNADGMDDLVYSDPQGNGTISIHMGSTTGPGQLADRILVGSYGNSSLGEGMAIGDFNCDGYDDLAASEYGLGFNDSGHIHIRLGTSSGISDAFWWSMNGSEDAGLGWSITALGDVENDGCDDLAVVANVEHSEDNSGTVVILKGNSTEMLHHGNITATKNGPMFGMSIAAGGDFNGDGLLDMAISNVGNEDSPLGYSSIEFFYGTQNGTSLTPFNTHELLVAGKLYGTEMAFVGDVHGDGFDDLIISELYASTTPYHSGKVHMWSGSSNGPVANWSDKGSFANALLGKTIAAAGDINEDGYDDFMLMAPSNSKSGQIDLYLGSSAGPRTDVQLFASGTSGENVGLNIVAGMDLDGDGMGDILYSSRDLTRGEQFGPVLNIMTERDWEFIDFTFDYKIEEIDMHTPLRGSPIVMVLGEDNSVMMLQHTEDGTPAGRWSQNTIANAQVAQMGISSSGQPVLITSHNGDFQYVTPTGHTGLEQLLNAGQGLGALMDTASDSTGLQRLAHASPAYSSIFHHEEIATGWSSATVRSNIDLLYPIDLHIDSNDNSNMIYVDDDDHMVHLATRNGSWGETMILNTTIGDDFDTIWTDDDVLMFAQVADVNGSNILQVVTHGDNLTIENIAVVNTSATFELDIIDQNVLGLAVMDGDWLEIHQRNLSGGNWTLSYNSWLLDVNSSNTLLMDGGVVIYDANDTISKVVQFSENGNWVANDFDLPNTNSTHELLMDGERYHITWTDDSDTMMWTTGKISHSSLQISTPFTMVATSQPIPLTLDESGNLAMAYANSNNDDLVAMRFVLDSDRDLIPDSHDDMPYVGNQWKDTDLDGFGDNDLGPRADDCVSVFGDSVYDLMGCVDYDSDGWSNAGDDCVSDDGMSWWGRNGCADLDQDGWSDNDAVYVGGDRFPTNWKQALDTDRDTYGDNHGPDCCDVTVLGETDYKTPDLFPYNRKQWADDDNDGYGDNESDVETGDKCPWIQGFSWRDRLGCVDSDGDGSSDPSDFGTFREWNEEDGADWWPNDETQWADSDGDGYGDNSSDNATLPDKFPYIPAAANDTDGDNYPNNWTALDNESNRMGLELDLCPDVWGNSTSPGYGCIDTDGDGMMDSADAFPEDPTQLADSDGDGWGDNQQGNNPDKCPFEPGISNGTLGPGCPIINNDDDDNDGVANEYDECENTEIGQSVDEVGCSDYQKDEDQDGVFDAVDLCPGTEFGANVDSDGCTDEQTEEDTDGDGVNDPIDLCPDSNPELSVDENGCNLDQKDSDGDGVNDLLDECPGTEQGLPVLATGCLDENALAEDLDGDGFKGPYEYNPDNNTHTGDAFPLDPTQWQDKDGDGYGDSSAPGANNSDSCPDDWGNSTMNNRLGCLDTDGDGYHDYLGDDAFPTDPTQWKDADLDNWGDNPDGNSPDLCLGTETSGNKTFQARENNGCAYYQLDSDDDGVTDDLDLCPNTEPGADVYPSGCPITVEEPKDEDEGLILGMEPMIFFIAAGGGGLLLLVSIIILVVTLGRGNDFDLDDDEDEDWFDDDEDEEDFLGGILGSRVNTGAPRGPAPRAGPGPSMGPGPRSGPPGGPQRGPGGPTRGPGGPMRGPSPGGPARGPSPGGPARGRGPSRGPGSGPIQGGPRPGPSSDGAARKKVAKRKPVGDGKVRKAKIEIDPELFANDELEDRKAAVDWTKGALKDGESERTILMQLQTTGWSAPQSRAIIDLSKR